MRTLVLAILALLLSANALAQSYKCQGADGKIEYSDRPCAPGKAILSDPTRKGAAFKPTVAPMERLNNLFAEYEERLCEREKLATEVDMANRSGDMKKDPEGWKAKQERLSFLNDTQIEFQEKASNITKGTNPESEENKELRRFRTKLRDCGKLPDPPPAPAPAAAPAKGTASAASPAKK